MMYDLYLDFSDCNEKYENFDDFADACEKIDSQCGIDYDLQETTFYNYAGQFDYRRGSIQEMMNKGQSIDKIFSACRDAEQIWRECCASW